MSGTDAASFVVSSWVFSPYCILFAHPGDVTNFSAPSDEGTGTMITFNCSFVIHVSIVKSQMPLHPPHELIVVEINIMCTDYDMWGFSATTAMQSRLCSCVCACCFWFSLKWKRRISHCMNLMGNMNPSEGWLMYISVFLFSFFRTSFRSLHMVLSKGCPIQDAPIAVQFLIELVQNHTIPKFSIK